MAKPAADKNTRTSSPMTAREFFMRNALGEGEEHALHTVVRKETATPDNVIRLWCSCDTMLSVPLNPVNQTVLQNVPEGKLGKLTLTKGGK